MPFANSPARQLPDTEPKQRFQFFGSQIFKTMVACRHNKPLLNKLLEKIHEAVETAKDMESLPSPMDSEVFDHNICSISVGIHPGTLTVFHIELHHIAGPPRTPPPRHDKFKYLVFPLDPKLAAALLRMRRRRRRSPIARLTDAAPYKLSAKRKQSLWMAKHSPALSATKPMFRRHIGRIQTRLDHVVLRARGFGGLARVTDIVLLSPYQVSDDTMFSLARPRLDRVRRIQQESAGGLHLRNRVVRRMIDENCKTPRLTWADRVRMLLSPAIPAVAICQRIIGYGETKITRDIATRVALRFAIKLASPVSRPGQWVRPRQLQFANSRLKALAAKRQRARQLQAALWPDSISQSPHSASIVPIEKYSHVVDEFGLRLERRVLQEPSAPFNPILQKTSDQRSTNDVLKRILTAEYKRVPINQAELPKYDLNRDHAHKTVRRMLEKMNANIRSNRSRNGRGGFDRHVIPQRFGS